MAKRKFYAYQQTKTQKAPFDTEKGLSEVIGVSKMKPSEHNPTLLHNKPLHPPNPKRSERIK